MKLSHTQEIPDELYEAARVSRFMQDGRVGRWQLQHFTVTQEEYDLKVKKLAITSKRAEYEIGRAVPPGDYITLRRQMIELERRTAIEDQVGMDVERIARITDKSEEQIISDICPDDVAWIPVMSDTPAEICEHDDALLNATGRVLITGLGLGCLPHALLTKPGVTSIDIIDIDPDVIALTGPYLTDPRVTIHHGSAADPVAAGVKAGRQFDYVWHDIWTHVSDKNLNDDTAEHGISYRRLFRLYQKLYVVGQQGAWALPMAKEMKRITDAERTEEREFRRRLKLMPIEDQVTAMKIRVARSRVVGDTSFDIPDAAALDLFAMMDPDGGFEAHLRRQLVDPEFWVKLEAKTAEPDRLGRPNEHLEANA